MSISRFLKADRIKQAEGRAVRALEYSEGLVDIRDINLSGGCSRSPNGLFLLCWEDRDYNGSKRGGYRNCGNGRIALLNGAILLWQRELQRPNDGVVSNDGIIAINDWLFRTDEDYDNGTYLKGTFFLIAPDGSVVFQETFRANLDRCGISPDGRGAWCSTAVSDYQDHSRIIANYEITGADIKGTVRNL